MKRIVCLGAGESGVGAAILARKMGFDAFVSDSGAIKDQYKQMLRDHGIGWEEHGHTESLIVSADEVVKSPGIADSAAMVQRLRAQGTHIISEIEFAGRYTDARMICITGSNGKTTTTSLIHHILRKAGMDAGLAGNIGRSLALQVAEEGHETYVVELSSFQLDGMYDFRVNIAVLMNITPDHLDRYDFRMENYAASKMRIVQNQTPDDAFIYWADDKWIGSTPWPSTRGRAYPFTAESQLPGGLDKSLLALKGRHNLLNSLAAAKAAELAGVPMEIIHAGLQDFPGVEHRLQYVREVGGVEFFNDSKATNVDACRYALESMTRPTVLILGGLDKGNDYGEIRDLVGEKCIGLVYLGVDNRKLHENFDALGLPVKDVRNMKDCVAECVGMSHRGCAVLLSPCCASFDLFRNMEDRGKQFMDNVWLVE